MEIRNRPMTAHGNPSLLIFDFGKTLSCNLDSGKVFFYGKKNRNAKKIYQLGLSEHSKNRLTVTDYK